MSKSNKSIGSIFTTLMAKILFAVLIVAFGAWGVADMLRTNPNREAVISVGDVDVTTKQALRGFVRELQNLRQNFGPQFTAAEAQKFGVFDQALSQMATRALLDAAAHDMNIGVSDKAMQDLIMSNGAFLGEDGKFNRALFRRVLDNNGYTENEFLETTRDDLTRQRIIDSVQGSVQAPDILVKTLLRYEGERRTADTFTINANSMPAPKDPGDDALKAYQKDNAARYTSPETRDMTVLVIAPKDVQNSIKVDDAELKKYFENNVDEFLEPETRQLSQILATDKAEADKIAKALSEGRSMAKVAKANGKSVTDLGWVDKNNLVDMIAVPAFAASKGDVLKPIETPLGWHVIKVNDAKAGKAPTFEEARAKTVEAVKADKTLTALYDASTAIEDSLASGASLEEAAKLANIKVVKLTAITNKGKNTEGKSDFGIPAMADITKAAFENGEGEQSTLLEYDGEPGGYFVVRTDAVKPAALKAFADVRKDLLKAWQSEEQQKAAVAKAKELAEAFAKAESIKNFAKANNVKITTNGPFYRSSRNVLPPALIREMFAAKPGQAGSAAIPTGAVVARLQNIEPVDIAEFKDSIEAGKAHIQNYLGSSLMMPFTTQLTETYNMRQHRSVESLVKELN